MNHQELVNRFWEYNEKEPLGAVAVALYLFLLELWAKNDEKNFNLSDSEICKKLKITRPTIITLRQKLSNLGMIQYQSKNGLPGYYKIIPEYLPVLSAFEKPETDKGDSTTKRSQKTISKKRKTVEKPIPKSETIQKQELISDNPTESQAPIPIPVSCNIPSLNEFTRYAKTLENYTPELDNLIKTKYDSWLRNGWKNGYNKPITNWKSSIKNALPFLQNELHSGTDLSSKMALQTIKRPRSNFEE